MAAKDQASADAEKAADAETPPVRAREVPSLRWVVVYPGISVSYPKGDGFETVTVPKGEFLDQHLPAEVAAEKGPFLQSIGHVAAVSGAS